MFSPCPGGSVVRAFVEAYRILLASNIVRRDKYDSTRERSMANECWEAINGFVWRSMVTSIHFLEVREDHAAKTMLGWQGSSSVILLKPARVKQSSTTLRSSPYLALGGYRTLGNIIMRSFNSFALHLQNKTVIRRRVVQYRRPPDWFWVEIEGSSHIPKDRRIAGKFQ